MTTVDNTTDQAALSKADGEPTAGAPAPTLAPPAPAPVPLQEGNYLVQAREFAFGFSSNDTPQCAARLEVVEGPSKGCEIVWYTYFSDATAQRSFAALRALGWDGMSLESVEPSILASPKTATATLKNDTYNGVTRLKVDRVGDPNKVDGIAMRDKIVNGDPRFGAFASAIESQLLAFQASGGGAAPPASKPKLGSGLRVGATPTGPAAIDDGDDIPF